MIASSARFAPSCCDLVHQDLRSRPDDAQRCADLVRHAGREHAGGRQLLRPDELLLQRLKPLRVSQPLREGRREALLADDEHADESDRRDQCQARQQRAGARGPFRAPESSLRKSRAGYASFRNPESRASPSRPRLRAREARRSSPRYPDSQALPLASVQASSACVRAAMSRGRQRVLPPQPIHCTPPESVTTIRPSGTERNADCRQPGGLDRDDHRLGAYREAVEVKTSCRYRLEGPGQRRR